jgi:type IV secretory pathway VirB6-like protein
MTTRVFQITANCQTCKFLNTRYIHIYARIFFFKAADLLYLFNILKT